MIITCNRCELGATKVSFQDKIYQLESVETPMFDLRKKASKGDPS